MARFRPLFLLVFLLSFSAQGEETLLHFQRGKARVEGGQLRVDFGSGSQLITNLWLTDPTGKAVSFKDVIPDDSQFRLGHSAVAAGSEPVFSFDGMEKNFRPLGNVTVARFEENGSHYIVWALNRSFLSYGTHTGGYQLVMQQIQPNEQGFEIMPGSGRCLTSSPRFLGDNHYSNEIAIVPGHNRFFTYDDRAGRLVTFSLRGNTISHDSDYAPIMVPWRIKLGESLEAQAEISMDERTSTLNVKMSQGEAPIVRIPFSAEAAYSPNARQEDTPMGRKGADRVIWAQGVNETLELMKGLPRYPNTMSLDASLTKWITQSTETLIPIEAPGRTRLLLVEMPGITIDQQPALSQEAALQVVESLRTHTESASPAPGVSYVRIANPWFDALQISTLLGTELLAHQAAAQSRSRHHFFIVDARSLGLRQSDDINLFGLIHLLGQTAASQPGMNSHVVVLGRKEFLENYKEHQRTAPSKPADTRSFSIDDSFSEEFKKSLIMMLLPHHFHGKLPTAQELDELIRAMKDQTGGSQVLSDLDQFLLRLGSILEARQPDLSNADARNEVASLYRKLAGDRRPARFEPAVIDSADRIYLSLSSGSDLNAGIQTGKVFVDRDEILKSIQKEIVTWLHYRSQNGSPNLILTFMGDKGTGKTSLAETLPTVIQGAKHETVKVSDLEKQFDEARREHGYWITPEIHLLMTLQAAADRLTLDPSPVKVLVIDEAHINPELFKTFLATADRRDVRGNRALNLDGLIVILTMNVDLTNENYQKLVDNEASKGEYYDWMTKLFEATLTKQPKNALSAEVAGPVAGRLSKKYFFKPISQDKDKQEQLIQDSVRTVADRHRCQIIVPDKVTQPLLKIMKNYQSGNYRTVEEQLELELAAAITRYERGKSGANLEGGIFILSHVEGDSFTLENARTPENQHFIIQESYRQYSQTVKNELQREIGAMRQYLQQPMSEEARNAAKGMLESYERTLSSFTTACQQPLFTQNAKGEYEIAQPGIETFPLHDARQARLLEKLQTLVKDFYPLQPGRYTAPTGDRQRAARLIAYTTAAVKEIERESQVSSDQTLAGSEFFGPPSPWLVEQGTRFESWRTGDEKAIRRKNEVEFMTAKIEEWRVLQKAIELESNGAMKTKHAVEAGRKMQRELLAIPAGKVDNEVLEKFIAALLQPGGLADAELMLKERTAAQSAEGAAAKLETPKMELVNISAGFIVDHIGRTMAQEQLKETRLNTVAVVGEPTRNAPPEPCGNTWQIIGREAAADMRTLFVDR